MRALNRLPEQQILRKKKGVWLSHFLASGKARPDSSKYAHKSVKADLNSMSFHKCFYCETKLKGLPSEVDHHIEVSIDKNLAFEWSNLFLSCDNCNDKIPHSTISVFAVLNPYSDDDIHIQNHLTFNKELIAPKHNSSIGLLTIKKYRLSTELLDNRRLKQLCAFQGVVITIRDAQIKESRSVLNDDEIELLTSFKRIDNPFSLMFTVLLNDFGL